MCGRRCERPRHDGGVRPLPERRRRNADRTGSADHASDDGTRVFPGIKALAEKTRQSERTIQYQLRRMEESGWLILVSAGNGGRSMTSEYRISLDWIKGAEIAPIQKGASDDEKGATGDKKGCKSAQERVQPVAPANNRHRTINEPSVNRAAAATPAKPSRGTVVPSDFEPDQTATRIAAETGVNLQAELANFLDTHCAWHRLQGLAGWFPHLAAQRCEVRPTWARRRRSTHPAEPAPLCRSCCNDLRRGEPVSDVSTLAHDELRSSQHRNKREASPITRKLFVLLHGSYGNLFLSKFATGQQSEDGGDKGVAAAMLVWDAALAKFAPDVIESAAKRLTAEHPDFAPNLPQFVKTCEAMTPRKTYAEENNLPALPAPVLTLRPAVSYEAKGDRKDWARAILAAQKPAKRSIRFACCLPVRRWAWKGG